MTDKQEDNDQSQKKPNWCFCKGINHVSSIIKILAIVGILIGINMIIQQNNKCQNDLKEYQMLQIVSKVDDIAHEQFAEMEATGNPHNWTGTEEFLRIDSGYHNAKTLEEKFTRAKEMNNFAENVDKWLNEIGGLDSSGDIARDKKFQEMDMLFNELK